MQHPHAKISKLLAVPDAHAFFDNLQSPMATLEASATLGHGSAITPSLGMLAAEPAEVQEAIPGEAEADIQRALFVGNYPRAVDVCLKVKRMWERVGTCRTGKTTLTNGFAFLALLSTSASWDAGWPPC